MVDSATYLAMAEHGVMAGGDTPLCYRLVVPLFARHMPFALEQNFLLLSFAAVTLTCIFLYRYLQQLGCSRSASLIGVLFFLQLRSVVACFTHPIETDSWGWLATIAALYLLQNGRMTLFSIVVALGVLGRESVLFVFGVFYTQHWRDPVRCIAVTLLPLAVFFGVRIAVPGPDFFHYYAGEIVRLWERRTSSEWWHVMPFNIYNAFGPLWILVYLRLKQEIDFLKTHSIFIVFVVVQLLCASDEMRLLTLLFPVVLLLCARALDSMFFLKNSS